MYKKKRHIDNKTGQPSIEAILYKDDSGYTMVKFENGKNIDTCRVNNWLGIKKEFNIEKKDLPLLVKGYKNKFSGSRMGTRIKDYNFVITRVFPKYLII